MVKTPNVAIIGVGEVGGCYANALHSISNLHLMDLLQAGPPLETAEALGITLKTQVGDWLSAMDFVLVCTPGGQCIPVAEAVRPYLQPGCHYIDMSTAAPNDLRQAALLFPADGPHFNDIAIMSSMQLSGAASPLLLAGPGADVIPEFYAQIGGEVSLVEGVAQAGDASSLKLLRSIIIKGLECLTIEALTAAESMQVRPQLMSVLKDLDEKPLADMFHMAVVTHAPHAKRRGHEMEEATAQLRELGFDALLTQHVASRYQKTDQLKAQIPGGERVSDMARSLQWLDQALRSK